METAVGDEVVPVDKSVVDVAEDGAVVDVPALLPLVVDTASCAFDTSDQLTIEINVSKKTEERLIFRATSFEGRLEEETSNRFVLRLAMENRSVLIVFRSAPRRRLP